MIDEKPATTKDRILDAAEHLFAQQGFDTSLRDITAAAGVNLAAVNYHFQSKDALVLAVFARRVRPVNEKRLAMLDAVEAAAAGGPVAIQDILRAFIEPTMELLRLPAGADAARLMGRMFVEPGDVFERFFKEQLAPVAGRFMTAVKRAMPDLPDAELFWRFLFAGGVAGYTIAGLHKVRVVSDGLCDTSDVQGMVDRVIAFVSAGFRAPYQPAPKGETPCTASR